MSKIHIIGGGLAGSEAAWQALRQGCQVNLYEMKPEKRSPAHKSNDLAELVCSNSLKSLGEASAPGQLKREMTALDSLIIKSAMTARVPAGQALAVDRTIFSREVTESLASQPGFSLYAGEICSLPADLVDYTSGDPIIVATGPLTSEALAEHLATRIGRDDNLYFYDAIAPVVSGESLDRSIIYQASRWDDGPGDYLNIPLDKAQYEAFIDSVLASEIVPLHEFEEPKYFESCLPIEVMIERGRETLRFGPMKPVGLTNPETDRWAYANVQLRMEDKQGEMYSMVGFQTKLKWPDQKRIFAALPGMANVEFYKMGSVHRNTFINSPELLGADLRVENLDLNLYFAGQISGVEGYTESAAMGLLAGRYAAAQLTGSTFQHPPAVTMMGALHDHVINGSKGEFQPMNANLGLLPTIPKTRGVGKPERKKRQCDRAWDSFLGYL